MASLNGIGELLSGTGLGFTRVNADFNYAPGNIHIDNWQMLGPSIGMTGQGGIYFDAQQVNLRGTVTPLGVLNGNNPAVTAVWYPVERFGRWRAFQ